MTIKLREELIGLLTKMAQSANLSIGNNVEGILKNSVREKNVGEIIDESEEEIANGQCIIVKTKEQQKAFWDSL